jgi:hypothetical protein
MVKTNGRVVWQDNWVMPTLLWRKIHHLLLAAVQDQGSR